MASAEIEKTLYVEPQRLFEAVIKYEEYPEFVDGVKRVEVKRDDGKPTVVKYYFSLFKDFEYELEHFEDPEKGTVQWSLIESDLFNKNSGKWEITPAGEGLTQVKYSIDVDFKVPVPGFIVKRLVKGNLPGMIQSFEERAKL